MDDILKDLCKNFNIKLSYTNNKKSVLSCNFQNNQYIIRAHKIFSKCDTVTAQAIIDYYTKTEKTEDNFKIIKNYVDSNFNSKIYTIIPPNEQLYNQIVKEDNLNEDSSLIKLDISSITKKNFHGDVYIVDPNDPLKVPEDDILEINITVTPPSIHNK